MASPQQTLEGNSRPSYPVDNAQTGFNTPHEASGHATNLEQAKAAIADNWEKWLALAKLKEIE
jgi:hypothetical protein